MIRNVEPADIEIFYGHQDDPLASAMAAFPSRDRASHNAHWARVIENDAVILRTIVDGDLVVGNIVCFPMEGQHNIGYWIGRAHWGRGYATGALSDFVRELPIRPLYARVADHNAGSGRVLEKCGFVVVGHETHEGDPVTEVVWRRDS